MPNIARGKGPRGYTEICAEQKKERMKRTTDADGKTEHSQRLNVKKDPTSRVPRIDTRSKFGRHVTEHVERQRSRSTFLKI